MVKREENLLASQFFRQSSFFLSSTFNKMLGRHYKVFNMKKWACHLQVISLLTLDSNSKLTAQNVKSRIHIQIVYFLLQKLQYITKVGKYKQQIT